MNDTDALREFSDEVNVLVPFPAHSCATLIALSADNIVTGPFAQLSPIDPSITTPHGPVIEQGGDKKFVPVSVEDVANYFALARNEAGLKDEPHLAGVFAHLTERVNPLALGAVYRAHEQIGMLATKLCVFPAQAAAPVSDGRKVGARESTVRNIAVAPASEVLVTIR